MRSLVLLIYVACASDVFEWFRCDSCRATFFKLKEIGSKYPRLQQMKDYEFFDTLEGFCSTTFNKHDYGVKQYEDKSYLFGPGVIDHLGPDKGFGQMGMGDYDHRLKAYCRMFIEDVGEERIFKMLKEGTLDKEELCREECLTNASGSGPKIEKASKSAAATKKHKSKQSASSKEAGKSADLPTRDSLPTRDKAKKTGVETNKPKEPREEEGKCANPEKIQHSLDRLSADELRDLILLATEKLHAKIKV